MKIIKALAAAGVLVAFATALSGCAHVAAWGGNSNQELAGKAGGAASSTGLQDYRNVLSSPGPF